jgi:hypothetical protein
VPYVISVLMAAAAAVTLCTLLVQLVRPARRLVETARRSRAHFADRAGLLAARIAALRVELDRRRHRRRNAEGSHPASAA